MHPGLEARAKPGRGRGRGTPRRARTARPTKPRAVGSGVPGEGPLGPSGGSGGARALGGGGGMVPLGEVHLILESLEEVERRIQPGSIKHSVFRVLRDAGAEGLAIGDISAAIQEQGLKTWDDPKQAKNSGAPDCIFSYSRTVFEGASLALGGPLERATSRASEGGLSTPKGGLAAG